MFDIAWSEMAVIIVVALIVIGPKDVPVVLKTIKEWRSKLQLFREEMTSVANGIMKEAEIQHMRQELQNEALQINNRIRQIVDLEGNLRDAYDIADIRLDIKQDSIKTEENTSPLNHPLP